MIAFNRVLRKGWELHTLDSLREVVALEVEGVVNADADARRVERTRASFMVI